MRPHRPHGSWDWLASFPTTNGQLVFGMVLTTIVVVVPLWLMVIGHEARINETVVGMLIGGTLGNSGVSTWQKIRKWQEMPESGVEEPPTPSDPPPVPIAPPVTPLPVVPRPSPAEPSD